MMSQQKLERIQFLEESMDGRHLRVCGHILDGKDQGEAWKAEYPRVKRRETAQAACSRMLADVKSFGQEYLDLRRWAATAAAADRLGIDEEYVLAGLQSIADDDGATDGNRRQALVEIGRHLGMFRDRLEHQGPVVTQITRRIVSLDGEDTL